MVSGNDKTAEAFRRYILDSFIFNEPNSFAYHESDEAQKVHDQLRRVFDRVAVFHLKTLLGGSVSTHRDQKRLISKSVVGSDSLESEVSVVSSVSSFSSDTFISDASLS